MYDLKYIIHKSHRLYFLYIIFVHLFAVSRGKRRKPHTDLDCDLMEEERELIKSKRELIELYKTKTKLEIRLLKKQLGELDWFVT